MDEAVPVKLAQGRSNADGEPQKISHLHGRAEQPRERLAAGIIEHQKGLAAFAHQFERPHCPRAIEFVLQIKLVSEAINASGQRMFGRGTH